MTSDPGIELIVIAYNKVDKASEVFNKLPALEKDGFVNVITAAVLVKDMEGETSTVETMDIAHKKGTRYGAIAGGLVAIIAPPVGVASLLVGAVGGAIIGRKVKKKPERNFTKDFLETVLSDMRGDSSALVVLSDSAAATLTANTLKRFGGELFRQTLTDDAVNQLAQSSEEAKSEKAQSTEGQDTEFQQELSDVVKLGTTRKGTEIKRVMVIINPGAGQDVTILNTLNTVFRATDIDWDIAITKKAGDAARLAHEAAVSGNVDIVAVYGGDGTVMETAGGLIGTDMPLAILPGGTNNVLSVELGIPKDLVQAAGLIGNSAVRLRPVDMAKANDKLFILRVGIGYEAQINELADREMKDRYGGLAYTLAGIKALKNPPVATYRITMDGDRVEELEGIWCMIANSASLGIPNVGIAQGVDVSDGLLDVIVIRNRDIESLLSVTGSITNKDRIGKSLPHWQVREVTIEADPPMSVDGDGELWDPTPIQASVIPHAVQILVPV